MSAMLGPIHHWIYRKIEAQEMLNRQIVTVAKENGWEEQALDKPLESFYREELPPLEEVIDLSNIHAWLSSSISDIETRYAELVTGLLVNHPERLKTMEEICFRFGQEYAIPAGATIEEVFQEIQSLFLDGMPCDRAIRIMENNGSVISFQRVLDLHTEYWRAVQGDSENYYALRKRIVEGMLSESGYRLNTVGDGIYELYFSVA